MTIKSCDVLYSTRHHEPQNMYDLHQRNVSHTSLLKNDLVKEGSINYSSGGKRRKNNKNCNSKSPYLTGDNTLLASVTEKRFFRKKDTNVTSSILKVASLLKANSDEFKAPKNKKKVKKSVLTLPTKQAPVPQTCTVSDMNDSEYCSKDNVCRKKGKKRKTTGSRKLQGYNRNYEYYEKDADYCSQMNIDLGNSSTDFMKKYKGDGKRTTKSIVGANRHIDEKANLHDVWRVLRNINRFQFTPSPPVSEDSFKIKKKKVPKRRNNRKDMRVVKTCHTEEFAYISSYNVNNHNKTPRSFSPDSSFDRITVIDKRDRLEQIYNSCKNETVKEPNLAQTVNNKVKKQCSEAFKRSGTGNNSKFLNYMPKKKVTQYDDFCAESSLATTSNTEIEHVLTNSKSKEHNSEVSNPNNVSPLSSKALIGNKINNYSKEENELAAPIKTVEILDNFRHISPIQPIVLNKGVNVVKCNKSASLTCNRNNSSNIRSNKLWSLKPKLTEMDIKRRISRLKFPIVVLGKDEFTDVGYEVMNEEPPQFNGLDKHIWPFMIEWYPFENETTEYSLKPKIIQKGYKRKNLHEHEIVTRSNINNHNATSERTHMLLNDDIPLSLNYKLDSKVKNQQRLEPTKIGPTSTVSNIIVKNEKQKPKKDRMIKLLYTHSSIHKVSDQSTQIGYLDKIENNDVSISTTVGVYKDSKCNSIKKTSTKIIGKNQKTLITNEKVLWSNSKQTNELIENIIRKIKSGIYHTTENKYTNYHIDNGLEIAKIRTTSSSTNTEKTLQPNSDLVIPGFDSALPALEITTMNANEITIKHHMTNTVVQFDVTMSIAPNLKTKQNTALVPLAITESQTKIYKCTTSIPNAMLPAQICTLIPKMLHNIITLGKELSISNPLPSPTPTLLPELSTISEVTAIHESRDVFPISPSKSLQITRFMNGSIKANDMSPKIHILGNTTFMARYESLDALKPNLSAQHLFAGEVNPLYWLLLVPNLKGNTKNTFAISKQNSCRSLVPYGTLDQRPLSINKSAISLTTVQQYSKKIKEIVTKSPNIMLLTDISLNLSITNSVTDIYNGSRLSFGYFVLDIPFQIGMNNDKLFDKIAPINKIVGLYEQPKSLRTFLKNTEEKEVQNKVALSRNKKHGKAVKVKRSKKSKRSFNTWAEKATDLNEISNMDEFFRALGAGNYLSSVFENTTSGQKILSCIGEMKNWTTEINPKQALLVLLLTNKEHTPNLSRYRTLLLQGISANRITKASELDLEIEVIEREELILSKYEGISYVPASIENRDSIFEELCWIAKNTASDYQRPFDKSSEKLLKSLLRKRKRLNPSYLRVMARYVGLGLLKTPRKK